MLSWLERQSPGHDDWEKVCCSDVVWCQMLLMLVQDSLELCVHDSLCLMGTAGTAVDACTSTELEEPGGSNACSMPKPAVIASVALAKLAHKVPMVALCFVDSIHPLQELAL